MSKWPREGDDAEVDVEELFCTHEQFVKSAASRDPGNTSSHASDEEKSQNVCPLVHRPTGMESIGLYDA